jgi:DNA-binding response OmpR family regulator
MNILYVEDEPNDAQLVDLYVKTTAHQLSIANNMQEARNAFRAHPHVILIDVLLGHKREGYQLIREFRAQGYTRPVIAITGLSTPRDVEECQKAGFDHILHKPFMIDELATVIEKYTA